MQSSNTFPRHMTWLLNASLSSSPVGVETGETVLNRTWKSSQIIALFKFGQGQWRIMQSFKLKMFELRFKNYFKYRHFRSEISKISQVRKRRSFFRTISTRIILWVMLFLQSRCLKKNDEKFASFFSRKW